MIPTTVLLLAAATVPALSGSFPAGVPSGSAISIWERITGHARSGETLIVYELYVNPLRPALYEITRFRAFPDNPLRDTPSDQTQNEILIWNDRPGQRKPLLCFERVAKRRRFPFWRPRWKWRALDPGTERYRARMFEAIRVYMLHRKNLGLGPP